MKKILILTETAGNGHNACARAMKEKLESKGGAEVKIVDILKEYSTKWNIWVVDKGYNLAVSKLLPFYNLFFNHYKKSKPSHRYSNMAQSTAISTLNGLMKEILTFQPDAIYSTHYNGAIAITDLKLVYDLPCLSVVANLDYVNSPFWESAIGVDHFVIPNEDFVKECIEEGFKKEQLLPFGLPVDERSLKTYDKAEARKKLGLADKLTIMVMFGGGCWSGGLKIFKNLIKALKGREAQVIMINGKDKKGYDKISKMKFEKNIKVLNVGFTKDVPLYMSASDIILNKFGGTSVTEMINSQLPMLITEKVPAQEKYNLVYMKEKGVALSFKNKRQLKENILKLVDDKKLRLSMSEKTKKLKKNAIEDVANLLLNAPKADYSKLLKQNIDLQSVKKNVKIALKKADKIERKGEKK